MATTKAWGVTVPERSQIGSAGAAEDDRRRGLNAFRRLLDGLDTPLQVVIDVQPGPGDETLASHAVPTDADDMRGADMEFAAAVVQSSTAHSTSTRFVTAQRHASRMQAALNEMGIGCAVAPLSGSLAFGRELASRFQHVCGYSRSWYVDRFPGTDIEPGWLFRVFPPGLAISLAWHAGPLPAADRKSVV